MSNAAHRVAQTIIYALVSIMAGYAGVLLVTFATAADGAAAIVPGLLAVAMLTLALLLALSVLDDIRTLLRKQR